MPAALGGPHLDVAGGTELGGQDIGAPGGDTEAALELCGFSAEDIAAMRAEGVLT